MHTTARLGKSMIEYFLIAWMIFILLGALIGAALTGDGVITIIFAGITALASGFILLAIYILLWAFTTVAAYFGVPILLIIAIIVLAWFVKNLIVDK